MIAESKVELELEVHDLHVSNTLERLIPFLIGKAIERKVYNRKKYTNKESQGRFPFKDRLLFIRDYTMYVVAVTFGTT